MHMRTKKWARPELAACPFYINHEGADETLRGTWKARFAHPERPLHMEMGCGKGVSTAKMIADHPEINYIVCDMSPDVLGTARRNMEEACGGSPDNVLILRADICFIHRVFGPEDAPERIYIHFCNPWTEHPKQAKRRLTHPRQLMQYREFLSDGGEIWLKTDDDTLFEESLVYFDLCGFETVWRTGDLHRAERGMGDSDMGHTGDLHGAERPRGMSATVASEDEPGEYDPMIRYISEHEQKYMEMGVPIKAGIFRKVDLAEGFDPTRYRLTPGVKKEALKRLGWA